MHGSLLVPLALALLSTGSAQDGERWLKQAEERLYRQPASGAVVRFEARTDVLEPMLAQIRADVAAQPDEQAQRLVDALGRVTVRGTLDPASGQMNADVVVPYETSDARTQKALAEIRARVSSAVRGCFDSLPFQDPSLLRKGFVVAKCQESEAEVVVALQPAQGG
jgi:hypothetical protein